MTTKDALETAGAAVLLIGGWMAIYTAGSAKRWRPTFQSAPKKDPNRFVYAWLAVAAFGGIFAVFVEVIMGA